VLLVGPAPPDMLLRHIAEAIARDLGVTICTVNSRNLARAGDLATILTSGQAGDMMYMDDVNALVPAIHSMLREGMVESAVDVGSGKGSLARTLRMTCQRFTLVGGVPSRRALTSDVVWDGASHVKGRGCGRRSALPRRLARGRALWACRHGGRSPRRLRGPHPPGCRGYQRLTLLSP
jgi:hypothetical protein